MIRVTGVTTKAPWLLHLTRPGPRAATSSKERDPAEQAAALQRSETHYRRMRYAAEASFLMNGGRYL